MSGINGYSDQKKNGSKQEFVTVSPVRAQQNGLDVNAHMAVQSIGSDAVEAGSTTTVINATAHAALRGDVISFTSGNLNTLEVKVKEVATDTITLVEALSEAPAATDTFDILRHKYVLVASDGGITTTSGPIQYKLNGTNTTVLEDTSTAANNRPLPVKLVNAAGDVIGQQAMAASLPVAIASDQDALPVSQSGTWNITDVSGTVSLPTGAATEATLASIETETANISSDTDTIVTNTGTIAGDTTSIDGKLAALGQAAMAASMPVALASDQSAIPVTQSGTWNVNNVAGTISLPTGAATEATLAAQSAKLPASLGQKAAANSMSVVLASDQTAIPSPSGRAYADSARNDYSSGNVTTGAWTQLIASTTAAINLLYVFDSSGQTMEIGTGAAASETRKILVPPGGCDGGIPISIPASTRISVRAVSATASVGEIDIMGLN